MVRGIGHIAVRAADIEKSAAFYRDVLGFPEAFRMCDGTSGAPSSVHLLVGRAQFIEIFPDGKAGERADDAAGLHHLCIETDDIYGDFDTVRLRGAPIDSPIKTGLSGCLQFWTHDPDGGAIEYMQLQAGCLRTAAKERLAEAAAARPQASRP